MKLPRKMQHAMSVVYYGADVYDYEIACTLREIERKFPSLVILTRAANPPRDGARQQPYFGAILTLKGREALRK